MTASYSSAEFEEAYTYTGSDLGANWEPHQTFFRLWAPTVVAAYVLLYQSGTEGTDDLIDRFPMSADIQGTWSCTIPGDLNGTYYTYLVDLGEYWEEACDPYARSSGVNGRRSMVLSLKSTDPMGWETDRNPNKALKINDIILYELHIRDLTVNRSSGIHHKGKFLGLTETHTHTKSGLPTGLAHIKELGVTHVHLMPVFDYGSVDEAASGRKQYNWGYDPAQFNVPEGSFSTDPYHGEIRVREMKQMIKTLHDNGISVVMDVVYNHVFHADDFSFNRLVPGYFSRGQKSNGSGCGNDTASERSMVRKFIVDSVNYWADEYHVDGFRFDLVGLIDVQTIQEVIKTVHLRHPDCIFYGEGWDLSTCVSKEHTPLAVQRNAAMLPGFAFFNDSLRDGIRGSVFSLSDKGFANGGTHYKYTLEKSFYGLPDWSTGPFQTVNYISCHDDHTLADRLRLSNPGINREELIQRNKLAAAFVFLSQGIPFFQAGEEMLRSKRTRTGHMISNSYNLSDSINAIKWDDLNDPAIHGLYQYYRGLIAFRKNYPSLRYSTATEARDNIFPVACQCEGLMVFVVYGRDTRLTIAFNAETSPQKFLLPKGDWEILINGNQAGTTPIGCCRETISVPALSAMALVQRKRSSD